MDTFFFNLKIATNSPNPNNKNFEKQLWHSDQNKCIKHRAIYAIVFNRKFFSFKRCTNIFWTWRYLKYMKCLMLSFINVLGNDILRSYWSTIKYYMNCSYQSIDRFLLCKTRTHKKPHTHAKYVYKTWFIILIQIFIDGFEKYPSKYKCQNTIR